MKFVATTIEWLTGWLLRLRNRHFFVLDLVLLLAIPALALILRMDNPAALQTYGPSLAVLTLVFLAVKVVIFHAAGLYNRYWKYAGIDELAKITLAVAGAVAVQAALFYLILRPLGWVAPDFPRSVPLIDGLLTLLAVGGVRFSVRLAMRLQQRFRPNGHSRRVLVVGAGTAGITMVQEMRSNPRLGLHPVAFVDDDPEKQGMRIRGLNVFGGHENLPDLVHEHDIELIVIAIPRAPGKEVREIIEICRKTGVEAKTVPGVYELLDDQVSVSQLRDVQVEDLLRRAPVEGNQERVEALLRGRRVLITGAGGSIGSELCRQIMRMQPAEVVLLGHGENSIFTVEAELRRRQKTHPRPIEIRSVIADIRDQPRMRHVFGLHQPEIVFHAAAHKHVPLMEANVEDAVTNNILGTQTLLELAVETGVERFILISTDKAVDPTSVMGATKHIAELLVRDTVAETNKAFLAVRFGNVLGSRGSVLEIFRRQLAKGGPLTVTHPDVTRYFMTIPEAVHLVLQAAAMGNGGEIFALDMGRPIRVVDLARDLIRLSGMSEGRDIDLVFTGLRPGEKMNEQLYAAEERFGRTTHEKIFVCRQHGDSADIDHWTEADRSRLHGHLSRLFDAAKNGDTTETLALIGRLIPSFQNGDAASVEIAFPVGREKP